MPFVGSLQPPPTAVAFRLWSLTLKMGARTTEGGRPWKNWIATRVLLPAGPDGVAGDVFPAGFGSTEILSTFGAGRYRVEWLNEHGKRVGEHMHTFELQAPAGERVPIVEGPSSAGPSSAAPQRGASGLEGMSAFDLLAFLDSRESRVEEKMRAQAERDRERDQQFFGLVLQTLKESSARPAPAGFDPDLVRRELRVSVAEQMGQLRAELGEAGPPEDLAPPKNPGQAAARLGMRFVGELEAALPGIVKRIVPALVAKLDAAGIAVPGEALAAAGALRAQPDPLGVDVATLETIANEAVAGLGEH